MHSNGHSSGAMPGKISEEQMRDLFAKVVMVPWSPIPRSGRGGITTESIGRAASESGMGQALTRL